MPVMPGTAGAFLALIVYFLLPGFRGVWLMAAAGLTFFIGVYVSGREEDEGGKDPSFVVIDEIDGMWLTLAGLPPGLHWLWPAAGFVLFRIFDVLKPFPVNRSQALPGGWGIMIDDILAALYSIICLRIALILF
jgi:phosphatidylglycerophosphatase A